MNDEFSRFFRPGRVHRQIYSDPAIFDAGNGAYLRCCLGLCRPRKPSQEPRRLLCNADRAQTRGDGARRGRRSSGDPQPVRPPRRYGGGDREGFSRRVHLLLPWLDLSSRRPDQGGAAQPRLSARFRCQESQGGHARSAAGDELPRFRVRKRGGRRAKPRRVAWPYDRVAGRHGRPRPRRRDRSGRRHLQARV